jgi:hypothetical protein
VSGWVVGCERYARAVGGNAERDHDFLAADVGESIVQALAAFGVAGSGFVDEGEQSFFHVIEAFEGGVVGAVDLLGKFGV